MIKTRKTKTLYLPNNLRLLREKKGLTQDQVAEGAGITLDYVSKLERGIRTLDHELMIALAKPLGCKPEALIVRDIPSVPVKGIIVAGVMVELLNEAEVTQAAIPVGVEYIPELEAYRFEDDSNAPMAYKDWLFYVGKKQIGCDDFSNTPYLLETADGLLMFRKIRRGFVPGHFNLLNPITNAINEDVAIKWCAKMISVIPA